MEFSEDRDSISTWVDDRISEAQIFCVHARDTAELVGLILLFDNPEETAVPTIQLGYFLGEAHWGHGYATEMIKGLLATLRGDRQMRLAAGVDRDNVGSVKVLEKSGFRKIPAQTTAGRYYFDLTIN
jgi:ribosomal-protein-alanine N-acetyltransferase